MNVSRAVASIWAVAAVNVIVLVLCYRIMSRLGLSRKFVGLVVVATWVTEYALRPIAIAVQGEFGHEGGYSRVLRDLPLAAVIDANIVSLSSTVALTFGLLATTTTAPRLSLARRLERAPYSPARRRTNRSRIPIAALLVVAALASAAAALQIGKLGGAVSGELGRAYVTSGFVYFAVNLGGLAVLVALVVLSPSQIIRMKAVLLAGFAAFLAVHVLVLGGRAEIVIVATAAVFIVTERFGKPGVRTLVVGVLAATALLGVQRVATREAFAPTNLDESRVQLTIDSLRNPVQLVTRFDVSAYDKLILLEEADLPFGRGNTYLPALFTPMPGIDQNELEGGNRTFTRLFVRSRYELNRTFEGISLLGEARYNFGWAGPPAIAFVVGSTLGAITTRARMGPKWMLLSGLATGIFPSAVRADALNTVALGGALIVLTLVLHAVVSATAHAPVASSSSLG